jgi:demethylmenaquinone methyltransferase/2-methoxy-6-polyprenyl-1,4-benzoquinol methylase
MPERQLTSRSVQRLYDVLAPRYDWISFYEARSKQLALDCLELAPGQAVLEVGSGTGKNLSEVQARVQSQGLATGIDLSFTMLQVARKRKVEALVQAAGAWLPFPADSFDRLLCTYVLDLVALADLLLWLVEFRRVLKPGGRVVLLSLTEGVDLFSKGLVAVWKLAYRVSPVACGGCRPLQLSGLVSQAGFTRVERQVVVQAGVPSELLVAI